MSKSPVPTLKLTHATLNQEVTIYLPNLFLMYQSAQLQATIVASPQTATVPVKETPDEIEMQISRVLAALQSGGGLLQQTSGQETDVQVQTPAKTEPPQSTQKSVIIGV